MDVNVEVGKKTACNDYISSIGNRIGHSLRSRVRSCVMFANK
jgi:hypothetical protein